MKIPLKRLLCIILSLVMMAGVVPMKVNAYSFKEEYVITSLKQNTYVSKKSDEARDWVIYRQLYKIKVPADGYIKIQSNNNLDSVHIFKKLDKNKGLDSNVGSYVGKDHRSIGKTYYQALRKGTYYLHIEGNHKIKWNLVNPKNYDQQKNYCRAKAMTLPKGKKKTVFFNYRYDFPRWYKITLTKKQRITLNCTFLDEGEFHYEIVDSRGLDVDDTYNSFYYANYYGGKKPKDKTKVLPKGTYYLFIERDGETDNESRICQISWN